MSDASSGFVVTAMSTSALEDKLKDLRAKSNKHSQLLTARLASSQSGQNLLHIGTSLQTLPPDLHSLLTQLLPVLSCAETAEKEYLQRLERLVDCGTRIKVERRRVGHARECADLFRDLVVAEERVRLDASQRKRASSFASSFASASTSTADHVSLLERSAQTTLVLVQELQASTDVVAAMTAGGSVGISKHNTADSASRSAPASGALPSMRSPLDEDSERARFLMRLAPRIRRLESDVIFSLSYWTEETLKRLQDRRQLSELPGTDRHQPVPSEEKDGGGDASADAALPSENELLLMIGHCMRGLAILGRGKEVENIFARVAIMPLIRSKISMGRLDEGGSRGECAGLKSLLEDMVLSVSSTFGRVLELSEAMFDLETRVEVDLITDGVWVPIATALMADAGIKMAIFSPGLAGILQSNYVTLDKFLSKLAGSLLRESGAADVGAASTSASAAAVPSHLATAQSESESLAEALYYTPRLSAETIRRAQERIYLHPKTAEFSKKWNLPIYYQLRFGDCCARLNKAIESTTREGWTAEVFTGDKASETLVRNDVGFELSFFVELYDTLLGLWKPDVILQPLTNRFLRGAVQLIGRSVAFVKAGMDGELKFGDDGNGNGNGNNNKDAQGETGTTQNQVSRRLPPASSPTYSWGDSATDVAAVAWELAILETCLSHDYVSTICGALEDSSTGASAGAELRALVSEVLGETAAQIRPLVERAWNEIVVGHLIDRCSGVLGAVKGVVATYRMTNRPPPTQASPYVKTILRPLKEFADDLALRTPEHIGERWKIAVLASIADRYGTAVEELITTVQRTEVALQSRRTRKATSGGARISDGDKVKLQLFLDYQAFCGDAREVLGQGGGDLVSVVPGIARLGELTKEGAAMLHPK